MIKKGGEKINLNDIRDRIIIRQKNQETVLVNTIEELHKKKNIVIEKAFLVALGALQNGAKFVRFESTDYIFGLEFDDMTVYPQYRKDEIIITLGD